MNFLAKMEHKFGRYAIRNLSLILIILYVAGYIIQFANSSFFEYLTLNPYAIVHGQVWRIFSWLLIPPQEDNVFFAIIMLFFYYSIGTTLERTWGSFCYNVYLFGGMLFTVLGSFVMMAYCEISGNVWIVSGAVDRNTFYAYCGQYFSTFYVNMSIFLAYAATFPDNVVLLMFVLPVKVKWLGFIYGAYLIYEMIHGIYVLQGIGLGFIFPIVIGSSLLNFLVFFFTVRVYLKRGRKRQAAQRAYTKQMKQAENFAKISKHKCAICGRTEKDGDDLQFRFCSKCEGNYEYCQDHLYTHIHFTK